MKRLIAFLFILCSTWCYGGHVDSLQKIASGKYTAPKRLKAIIELADQLSAHYPAKAIATAKNGLSIAAKLNDKRATATLLSSIGKTYFSGGKYDSTAYFLNQSAAIFEGIKDDNGLADDYYQLARLYAKTDDPAKAAGFYNKAIATSKKTGPPRVTMGILNDAGRMSENQHKYREALNFFREAYNIKDSLDLAQKTKESNPESYSKDFIGDVFGSMNGKSEGEQDLLKTIETKRSLNDTLALAINYLNLGILYKEKTQYPKALDALQNSLQYAAIIKYTSLQSSALNELADLFEQTGDYRQSLAYFKKQMALNSTAHSRTGSAEIDELQTKYEITQREDQVLQQQFEISKRNYWVAGISVVLLLSLLLTYNYYKQTQLKQRNIAMQAIIETEEKERKRIAQDLHDSVSQTMSAAKINLTVIESELPFTSDEQRIRFEKAIRLVDDGFKEVRTISHNMMPWALHQTGLAQVIRQFIGNIENNTISINFFSKGFEEHFDGTVETILYRILQECINNVMKHAQASRIDISLMADKENISLTIEDNGKGFDMTDPLRYQGMGVKNMQTRVSFLKGKIEIDSHPGKGTLVSVYIPVKIEARQ